jgi:shikimate kinase
MMSFMECSSWMKAMILKGIYLCRRYTYSIEPAAHLITR